MNTPEIAAIAMQADQARLETLSQNLANVTTPGYKRRMDVQAPFAQWLAQGAAAVAPAPMRESAVDTSPGALRPTGDALDIVVDGGAFLELRTSQGLRYARGGRFHLDADGFAVTAGGEKLQLTSGDLKHNGPSTELHIDAQGNVLASGETVGRLRIVRFDDPARLHATGGGRFDAGMAAMSDDPGTASVRTGFSEASNVQSSQEMVRLLETSRHFEAMQKVFLGYDEMVEKAIRKFGEV